METKNFMKRRLGRGNSRLARVMTMLVLLLAMATGAWAQTWTNIIKNSNMEGTDVSCFYVQEKSKGGTFLARITDGIGVNGSRAIKVQTTGEESAGYETQFDIRLPYELPAGTQYRLSFDYRSDKAAVREDYYDDATDYSFGFQVSNEPGQYVWWTLGGWPAPYFETTEDNVNKWQHYEAEYTVPGDCNGSQSSDGDWLLNFQTIYIQLAKNKVATEFIIDNIKVEIDATVLAGLSEQPVTDPMLLIPYYDDDDVAVGKLKAAIKTYDDITNPTDADKATLKAAIDQFNADNADYEKDETAKVATDGWKKFNGEAAGVCDTQYAPAIDTYDGRKNVNLAECFEGNGNRTGTIIYQDITGLTNGQYKVGFYGNAFSTTQRDYFECIMEDGATDAAYVFANEKQQFITARLATSTTENNFRQFDVEVTDGTIKLGMGKAYGKSTNWHTMQIYQLTWFATAKQAYAAYQTELAALLTDAKALAADENKTEGKDAFNAVIATAEEATTTKADWYNNAEIAQIITDLKTATANFTKANWYIDFAAGQYYIIDAESNKMMAAGHDWGTRAIVSDEGLDLTLTPDAESRTVTIDSRVYNGENSHFLGSNLYMDGTAYGFAFEKQGTGFCILEPVSGKYISVDANDNLVMSDTPRQFNVVSKADMLTQLKTQMEAATADAPVDATLLLTAPNFNRNDARNAEAWTVEQTLTGQGHTTNLSGGEDNNTGTVGNNCADAYGTPFSFTQTITDAPAGTYRMTAQGFYEGSGDVPTFFANSVTGNVPAKTGSEGDMKSAAISFSAGKYTIDPIEFTVGDDGKIVLGISGTSSGQWVIFDNFRLTYLGAPAEEPGHVKLAKGTVDADNWKAKAGDAGEFTALPLEGVAEGTKVTVKYGGERRVKSVTAVVKGAAAPVSNTIYSWESPAGTVSQTGGTIEYKNGDTSNGDRVNYLHIDTGKYTICLNGKKNKITDGTASQDAGRMDVSLNNALAAGDVISITAYTYKDESKQSSAYIIFNGESGFDSNNMSVYAESAAFGDETNLHTNFNGTPKTVTVTVPEAAAGCKSFTMTRGITGTNLFITKLVITKGAANN